MQCEHPDFLPDAWRFSTVDETPAPVKNTLDFLETAFAALAKTLSDLRASRSIVTEISMKHGVQTIDPRGIAIIEFGMCIHELTKLQMDELGSVLIKMSLHATDDNESLISELVYDVLLSVSGLVDVLKTDVGNDIACVMGAIAAVYTPPSDSNKRVFDIVTRRIRNASRLSSTAKTDQNARAVLLDAAADYDDDERIKTIVSIALGKNTPILDDQCPQWVLNERNAPHKRFQRYMERLNYCKGSWSLIDALIPCGCMPIRTKHYVVYVNAVYEYADRLASMLAPPSEHDDSPERRCAWTLLAMSNPVVQNEEYFENILRSWCIARAHEPPARGTSCWITVRALLSRPKMDIDALSAHVNEFVSSWTDSIEEQNDIFGRIATFCISTRSPNGLRLICKNSLLASGVLHRPAPNTPMAIECLSHSPSGVLELGEYESGFSEWSDDYDDDDDDAQQQQLATDVVEKIKEQILIRLLRKDHSTSFTDSILRLTLLPETLLTRQWKFALESIQPEIEEAICNETGGGCFSESQELREKALRAVVFRAKCLRALSASSSPQPRACNTALVTWYCDPFGRCIVFARLFAPKCTINDLETVVIEYERLIRKAAAVYDATEVASATHVYKSMRVSEIGLKHGAFLDDTSMRLLRNATLVKYCSSSAVICAATTAVSVVHWPVAGR